MSTLNVTSIKGRAGATPSLPDGAVISGINTINAEGIDVSGGVNVTGLTTLGNNVSIAGTDNNNNVTLKNTSPNDSSNSRRSKIIFQGTRSGGEVSDLVHIAGQHDGGADSDHGAFRVHVNNGSGVTERFGIGQGGEYRVNQSIGSAGQVLTSAGSGSPAAWADSGGMWIKMASVDVAAGVAATTYDVFTDFASHTDKKWWKLMFAYESVDTADDLGLQVKIGGDWKTENYSYQNTRMAGTSEIATWQTDKEFVMLGNGHKWNRGEVLFFNNSAANVYQLFDSQTISLSYQWENITTGVQQMHQSGGAVGAGSSGPLQGIRLAHDDATWGTLNFALFAGNGW